MINNLKVFDAHVHFNVREEKPEVDERTAENRKAVREMSQYQSSQWKKAWGFPDAEPTPATLEESVEKWIADIYVLKFSFSCLKFDYKSNYFLYFCDLLPINKPITILTLYDNNS